MSPHQIFDSMSLLGMHEVRIVHGPAQEEWGIRMQAGSKIESDPLVGVRIEPPMVMFGNGSRRISTEHSITIEYSDPLKRDGNNQAAALRRLRNFMKARGFTETEFIGGDYFKRVTFENAACTAESAATGELPRDEPFEEARLPAIKMRHSSGPLDETALSAIERRFEIRLPSDYRAFLVRYNGGEPETPFYPCEEDESEGIFIEQFLSVSPPSDLMDEIDDFESTLELLQGGFGLPESLVPVARGESEDVICLAVSGEDCGTVYLWYLVEGGFDESHLTPLATSFVEFVRRLEADPEDD